MSTAIDEIQKQLRIKTDEFAEIQKALKRMHQVQEDMVALKRTLAILQVQEGPPPLPEALLAPAQAPGLNRSIRTIGQMSLLGYAYATLKRVGRPLTNDELVSEMQSTGCTSRKQSILGALYRAAKDNKLITIERSGVFGLLEWSGNGNAPSGTS